MPDELADMAQRYEEFRERNGYNNDRGGRGDRGGGGGGRVVEFVAKKPQLHPMFKRRPNHAIFVT